MKATTVADYLAEQVCYGGEWRSVGSLYAEYAYVDAWLMGYYRSGQSVRVTGEAA